MEKREKFVGKESNFLLGATQELPFILLQATIIVALITAYLVGCNNLLNDGPSSFRP